MFVLKNFRIFFVFDTKKKQKKTGNFEGLEPSHRWIEMRRGDAFFSRVWATMLNNLPKRNLWLHFVPSRLDFYRNFPGLLWRKCCIWVFFETANDFSFVSSSSAGHRFMSESPALLRQAVFRADYNEHSRYQFFELVSSGLALQTTLSCIEYEIPLGITYHVSNTIARNFPEGRSVRFAFSSVLARISLGIELLGN